MASTTGVAVRTLVGVFGCVGLFAFVYVYVLDCYSSCFDIHNRWLMAAYLPLFINLGVVAVWVFYKESSWIVATLITLLLAVFASVTTCVYIIIQFLKLSPEEFSKDPLYFILVKRHKRDDKRHRRGPSVLSVKMIFSSLGCLIVGTFIYVLIVDGSPFNAKVFSPCMVGTLIDFYATVVVLAVWITYKESSWISAFFWVLLLFCFGSITICVYIVQQLFHLSPQQPVSLVIFNRDHRDLLSRDPLLVRHADVQA